MVFRSDRILRVLVIVLSFSFLPVSKSYGQTTCANSQDVGCTIPNLFGNGTTGITLPQGFHTAHFVDAQQFSENFLPLNTAVATQLTLLPLPSPASGFTYELDSATGLRTPRAQTLGPILTERGETLGAKRLFLGFGYQRFRFNEIDGRDIDNLPAVFTHQHGTGTGGTSPDYERDIITTRNAFDLKIDQFFIFGSVGLTDRFDVSLAIPLARVRMRATADAAIDRIGNQLCAPPGVPPVNPCHYFDANNPQTSTSATFSNSSDASGVGDVTVRLKQNFYNSDTFSAAILGDIRLPTGDERNFLGSGAVGVKPFLALSWKGAQFAPHVNVGFQWNGESELGGQLATGEKESLPSQFFYSLGTEVGVVRNVTLSADLVGQRLFDARRVQEGTLNVEGRQLSVLTFPTENFSINDGSIGLKFSAADRFIFTINGLIALDNGGLRQRVTPLIGLSYLF